MRQKTNIRSLIQLDET